MKVAILRERAAGENRVAATPETAAKLIGLGASVSVEHDAGASARFADADYAAAGASIAGTPGEALQGAAIVLAVRRPELDLLKSLAPDTLLVGMLDPFGHEGDIAALAWAGITAIGMEFLPRITRAQTMDVLSSQANLAGYQSVIEAATAFGRAMPMMMTAAGTVRPAKVFVMGAGVAGLQAIATARRLGAVVSATDVRPAAKEQVESLGAKFIAVEDEEFRQAETAGGYAKEMSAEYRAKQAEMTASHIAQQDIVITTALIPGRPAPRLISRAMVESMAPGSVIVDLAAERGGNVELTVPGEVIEHGGVTIVGHTNLPSRIATTASQLYARNLFAFVESLVDKAERVLAPNWEDELLRASTLTRNGEITHPDISFDATALLATPLLSPVQSKASASAVPPGSKAASAAAAVAPRRQPGPRQTQIAKPAAQASKKAAAETAATGTTQSDPPGEATDTAPRKPRRRRASPPTPKSDEESS